MNREDFPMLTQHYIYFNNAATTYCPKSVINKINEYYCQYGVNLGRGVSSSSFKVTKMYEQVREEVGDFLNVSKNQIVFTRGTTEAINLVANHLKDILKINDQILISNEEHHAVFVTMQQLALKYKFELKVVDFEEIINNINSKTKLVAISHYTNVLGKRSQIEQICSLKKKYPFQLLVDGAQGIVHEQLNLKKLAIDYYMFSAHKLYGPKGVGVLYSNQFDQMSPYHYGGEMVDIVDDQNSTFKKAPHKFEAGTMMIPEVLAFGEAIKYVKKLKDQKINKHITKLRKYLINEMKNIPNIIIYNQKIDCHFIAFNVKGIHAHDVATFLDQNNIVVRAGHHCAAPLMKKLDVNATVRISLGLYNSLEECHNLIKVFKTKGAVLDGLRR